MYFKSKHTYGLPMAQWFWKNCLGLISGKYRRRHFQEYISKANSKFWIFALRSMNHDLHIAMKSLLITHSSYCTYTQILRLTIILDCQPLLVNTSSVFLQQCQQNSERVFARFHSWYKDKHVKRFSAAMPTEFQENVNVTKLAYLVKMSTGGR